MLCLCFGNAFVMLFVTFRPSGVSTAALTNISSSASPAPAASTDTHTHMLKLHKKTAARYALVTLFVTVRPPGFSTAPAKHMLRHL